jgi:LPS-assembly protein
MFLKSAHPLITHHAPFKLHRGLIRALMLVSLFAGWSISSDLLASTKKHTGLHHKLLAKADSALNIKTSTKRQPATLNQRLQDKVQPNTALLGEAAADALGQGLKLQPQWLRQLHPNTTELPTFVTGDTLTAQTDEWVDLQGNAELRQQGRVIYADHLRHTQLTDRLLAERNVRYISNDTLMTGDQLDLQLEANQGTLTQPTFDMGITKGKGYGSLLEFLGPNRYRINQGYYSVCRADDPSWYMTADTLDLDYTTEEAEARAGKVTFKGVPIFAAPSLSFPLHDGRRSGVLAPTFSATSTGGAELMVPYYWNIAPNRDLTLYPKYSDKRGLQLGLHGRYLDTAYRGEFKTEWNPRDEITGESRHYLSWQHTQSTNWLNRPNNIGLNFNATSDYRYFIDYSRSLLTTSTTTLPRDAFWTILPTPWLNVTTRVTRFQTLQDPAAPTTPPYERVPQITVTGNKLDVGPTDISLYSEWTRFSHPTLAAGNRWVFNPAVSLPILQPAYFVTPKLSLHATQYQLTEGNVTNTGLNPNAQRIVPTGSLDAGLFFERDLNFRQQNWLQTLEPRLFYVRTPYRDQSKLPNFDSALADFNFAQMFGENTYTGQDRISDANQLTAAVTTRLISPDSGIEMARLAIGQRLYFSEQRVTLPNVEPRKDNASDWLIATSATLKKGLQAEVNGQYSPDLGLFRRLSTGLRYRAHNADGTPNRNVINASYRTIRDTTDPTQFALQQLDISGQWMLTPRWYAVARANYSIKDRQFVETVGGVEYDGDCWVARVVLQRFSTSSQTATTALFTQLELNGFSKIGSSPLDVLRRNISGYSVINQPLPDQPLADPTQQRLQHYQ